MLILLKSIPLAKKKKKVSLDHTMGAYEQIEGLISGL